MGPAPVGPSLRLSGNGWPERRITRKSIQVRNWFGDLVVVEVESDRINAILAGPFNSLGEAKVAQAAIKSA